MMIFIRLGVAKVIGSYIRIGNCVESKRYMYRRIAHFSLWISCGVKNVVLMFVIVTVHQMEADRAGV